MSKTIYLTIIRAEAGGGLQLFWGNGLIAFLKKGRLYSKDFLHANDMFIIKDFISRGLGTFGKTVQWEDVDYNNKRKFFDAFAYTNTLTSIINLIQEKNHGGTLVFLDHEEKELKDPYIKIKYPLSESENHLHRLFSIYLERHDSNEKSAPTTEELFGPKAHDAMIKIWYESLNFKALHRLLLERCKFIANLTGADGALIMDNMFNLHGFSCEIKVADHENLQVHEISGNKSEVGILDIEEFGMRHRSAMRLSSKLPKSAIFVISQDGDINLIWSSENKVFFKRNIQINNAFTHYKKAT